jgi:signal transduction histidine kinase
MLQSGIIDTGATGSGFLPHGVCYLWNKPLLWSHLISDALIGLAYVAISATLIVLVYKARKDIPYQNMFIAFGLFIIACGATHFMEIWTLWEPSYWASAIVKIITAIASVSTAIALPGLVPKIVKTVHNAAMAQEREEELRQAQRMDAVGRLAGGIAHDFNNILTIIRTNAQMLMDSMPVADERFNDLKEIKQASDRAAALTSQLLAFGRKQILQPKLLDLNESVSSVEAMLKRVIGVGIVINTELVPGGAKVLADSTQIDQVIVNLAVNARDAMPEGGVLTIKTGKSGNMTTLTVSDTGTGIDEVTQERIFEPFFTTKEQGAGTGLGLATVHGIVTQSGGRVEVESVVGKGTKFTIFLPMAENDVPGASQ